MKIDITALRVVAANHHLPVTDVTEVVEEALNLAYRATEHATEGTTIVIDNEGDVWAVDVDGTRTEPTGFGRIAVTAMRNAVLSWTRDQERRAVVGPWAQREGRVFTGRIQGPGKNGEIRLRVENVNAVLPAGEQIAGENLAAGTELPVLLLAANADNGGRTKLTVSRRQPALVSALMAEACPPMAEGAITVVSIAREPGIRTKVALAATAGHDLDPVAEVVGAGGHRMRAVLEALGAEKVDLVAHSESITTYVAAALTPARGIVCEQLDDNGRQIRARVPVDQLSLAAGAGGLNVRLAQRLTGTKINLTPVD